MAHKKAGGSTALGRDSQGQRLGIKVTDGAHVRTGGIIVRQRGTAFRAGTNVRQGNDDTLFAHANGTVKFSTRTRIGFNGRPKKISIVSIAPTA